MIIFIEGPDGSGKTELVNRLNRGGYGPIVRLPKSQEFFKKGNIEEASWIFNNTIGQLISKCNFIVDRGYFSSLVYSKIYKRKTDLSYIWDIHKKLKPIIIFLDAKDSILFERRPIDAVIKSKERLRVSNEYRKMYNKLKAKKFNCIYRIDTSKLSPLEVYQKATKFIW
jgi:thymidylate kinase